MSAFQLLPTAVLVRSAGRTAKLPYTVATERGWDVHDLARVVFPFSGLRRGESYRELGDSAVYVGWLLTLAIPFALINRERRRLAIFLVFLGGLSFALALSQALPLYRLHYALLPGLRIPGRVLYLATFSLAVLGGFGVDEIIRLLARRSAVAARVAGAVAIIAVAGDLTVFAAPAVVPVPVAAPPARLMGLEHDDGGRAISVCEHRVGISELVAGRWPSLDGVEGLHNGSYTDWASLAKTGDRPPHDGVYRRVGSDGGWPARRDLIDAANVTTVFSCDRLDVDGLQLRGEQDHLFVYRNLAAWPRAIWTCADGGHSHEAVLAQQLRTRYTPERQLVPRAAVNVRWARALAPARRRDLEHRYGLTDGSMREARTWRYLLDDPSSANISALLSDPAVDDTAGIDKRRRRVIERPRAVESGGGPEALVGANRCADRGTVDIVAINRPSGRTSLRVASAVSGLVVVSEPFYAERRAYVDGHRVAARPANLAFTAIPVPAGQHRVELRYVPVSLYAGCGITLVTIGGWTVGARRERRRRREQSA
jgi:hypothetical protein